MNYFKSITLGALLSAATFSQVLAQGQTYQWKEATANGYNYKFIQGDATNTRYYTLKNGLTVILSPSTKEPRIQTYIATKAGSKTDPSTNTGLAHYLEHMLFKGTDKFGTKDWAKEKPLLDMIDTLYDRYNKTTDELARKNIYKQIDSVSSEAAKYAIPNEYDKLMSAMGAKGTNAFTSFEQTVYVEDIPSNVMDKFLEVQAERFRNPILRLFHTELEAVYEEKNRTLDNDGRKVIEAMFAALFPNNNYGQQTTIGTVEHLKNPSLKAIREYFTTYYVPNNMGIIMAGDFNPDEVIKKIDAAFSYMQPKAIPTYNVVQEKEITAPIVKDVYGPNPENIMLGFRFPGAATKDAQLLQLVGNILTNGSAGLIDLNLVQQQKLLSAYAFPYILKDYSMLLLQGSPSNGQSLDQVKDLLLAEIQKLRNGDFSEDLIKSIINNEKKAIIENNESYSERANILMDDFTSEIDHMTRVEMLDNLFKITKKDIVEFANKYLSDKNYVAVYKHKGEDKNIVKVDKPQITPVPVNREDESPFLVRVNNMKETDIKPVFLDYAKDIQKGNINKETEVLSVKNKDNALFRLYYYFEQGSWNNKYLSYAAEYLNFLGTKKKSAEDVSKDFYKLASSFSVNVGNETTTISLDGLDENFKSSVTMLEDLIRNCVADKDALDAYKDRIKKARANMKQNKDQIMRGLRSYAQYGANNPFNYGLTDAELDAMTADDLVKAIRDLFNYKHSVLYYGPKDNAALIAALKKDHQLPKTYKATPAAVSFKQLEMNENKVLFANYDMVQAEIYWTRNSTQYNSNLVPTITLFNNYYGGGMGSIVFQTIRESKALAYSTFAAYSSASKKEDKNVIMAYVGTQSDKFNDATVGMNELLTELPQSDKGVANAKEAVKKSIAAQRYSNESIIFSYLGAKKLGLNSDIRKNIYDQLPSLTFNDLKRFHSENIANKAYTYSVVANESRVKMEDMMKLGKVQKLTLEEIFGF